MNVIRLLKIKTADSAWLYRNVAKCDQAIFFDFSTGHGYQGNRYNTCT